MTDKTLYNREFLLNLAYKMIELAATKLPTDVEKQLKVAFNNERNKLAKSQLDTIIKNIEIAKNEKKPICQDTGLISFIISFGEKGPKLNIYDLKDIFIQSVIRATKNIPLRPNAINLSEGNTGTNVGENTPWFYYDFKKDRDFIELTVFLKGGGCTNVSVLKMLNPGEGLEGIKKSIINSTIDAGSKGCPPYTLGVGIGGGEDIAMILAKKALIVPPKKRNNNNELGKMELDLIKGLNKLGLGAMGLGGDSTILDVHVLNSARHPASLPLGLSFNCWALRYTTVRLFDDKIEIISHKREDLQI